MKIRKTRKTAAAVAIGASVLTGGALGAAFVSPLGAGAQDGQTTTTESSADSATTDSATATRGLPDFVATALDGLVADGTIDQAQRDAVAAALEAAQPAGGPGGPGGHGGPGGRHRGPGLDVAATALGMTADELRTELESGTTIAQVAEAKGVALQTVIDALVADMNDHLDKALADGRLTQEQADARKADATQRATDMVNGVRPEGPPPGAAADDQAPAGAAQDGGN